MNPAAPRRGAIALALAMTLAACDSPQAVHQHDQSAAFAVGAGRLGSDGRQALQATARFNSLTVALAAGYEQVSPCVSSPSGTMGFHYANLSLTDPVFDPAQPENLVYAPDANGKLHLVALEYVVIDIGQPAPTFDGHAFDVGGVPGIPVAHWTLHVWLYHPNPSGLYAPFNPDLACP